MREGSVATCNSSAFVISDETPFYSWLTRSAAKQPSHPLSRLVRRSRFLSLSLLFFFSVYPSCIFKLTDPWKFVAGSARLVTTPTPSPIRGIRVLDSTVRLDLEWNDPMIIRLISTLPERNSRDLKPSIGVFMDFGFRILLFYAWMCRWNRRFEFIMSRLGVILG